MLIRIRFTTLFWDWWLYLFPLVWRESQPKMSCFSALNIPLWTFTLKVIVMMVDVVFRIELWMKLSKFFTFLCFVVLFSPLTTNPVCLFSIIKYINWSISSQVTCRLNLLRLWHSAVVMISYATDHIINPILFFLVLRHWILVSLIKEALWISFRIIRWR